MVSPGRCEQSFSSGDKPPSPKRQKVDNVQKSASTAETSNEIPTPPALNPRNCGTNEALPPASVVPIAKGSVGKGGRSLFPVSICQIQKPLNSGQRGTNEALPPASAVSIAKDKGGRKLFPLSICHKQKPKSETSFPWCKLLSQSAENPNISISEPNFPVSLSDKTILFRVKRTQHEGSVIAMLKSLVRNVIVNGKVIQKNESCILKSGDEVAFPVPNHAYIFLQLVTEVTVRNTVAGAAMLSSRSCLRADLSQTNSTANTSSKIDLETDLPAHPGVHDGMDTDNTESNKAAFAKGKGKSLPTGCKDSCIEVLDERVKSLIRARILNGRNSEVSFESFPYYLRYNYKHS